MICEVNGKEHNVPFHLSDITLEKFIAYYDKYGKDLDNQLDEILKKDYTKTLTAKGYTDISEEDIALHKDIDLDNHIDNEALAWYSFWTGQDFFEVKDEPFITPILSQYRVLKYIMHEEMQKVYDFPQIINWNGEVWKIQDFRITPGSNTRTIEPTTAKQVILETHNMGLSRWHSLIYLCVVFFRKEGEIFEEKMIIDGSERMTLMKQLPLEHAFKVAFFLNRCVGIWKSILAFSTEGEEMIPSQN